MATDSRSLVFDNFLVAHGIYKTREPNMCTTTSVMESKTHTQIHTRITHTHTHTRTHTHEHTHTHTHTHTRTHTHTHTHGKQMAVGTRQ